jgi:hypothetical protein
MTTVTTDTTGTKETTETSEPPRLSDDQRADMMNLIAGADSVELKLTVPETDRFPVLQALGLDPLDIEVRQVFFFDTPDLQLNQAGVVARARRIQNKKGDSVVKLRPVVPQDLPEALRKLPDFSVEVDAMPGSYVCSATLKGVVANDRVSEAAAGRRPLRKLFSKEQREFFAEHAPDGIELDSLAVLGPITVFRLKSKPAGYKRKVVAELWNYPDYSRILELSTKCAPEETVSVVEEVRAFLTERGANLSGEQQTKTKTALEFFSERLNSA